jgi:hypothetical protein
MTMTMTITSHVSDKWTRPAGIVMPGDLLIWVEEQASQEHITKSRFVTQVLETERKSRSSIHIVK